MADDDNPDKYTRQALHSPASSRRLAGLKLSPN
jgi:hypothetical protein